MGIKSLTKFLKTQFSTVFQLIPLSELEGKLVAVDISIYVHKFKKSSGKNWLFIFINMVVTLLQHNIKLLFVYEGAALEDKKVEQNRRRQQREKANLRLKNMEEALCSYENTGVVSDHLLDIAKQCGAIRRLSKKNRINVGIINQLIQKTRIRNSTVDNADMKLTQQILDMLGVPFVTAFHEAETLCSDLCIQGKVFAVLSDDSDVYAYGAPITLSNLDIKNKTVYQTKYVDILHMLTFTTEQFLDFCIMCGTDYNKNIFKIGPKKSYKMILDHKNIETVGNYHDISILNHLRGRELFRHYDKFDGRLPVHKPIKISNVNSFLTKKHMLHILPLIKTLPCS